MNTNFTQDQLNAFDVFCKGRNILLTGAGGTGKTLLVKERTKTRDGSLSLSVETGNRPILFSISPRGRISAGTAYSFALFHTIARRDFE